VLSSLGAVTARLLVPDRENGLPVSVTNITFIPDLRVGSFQAGLGLWQLALPKAHHVFEIEDDLSRLNKGWPRRPAPLVSHTFVRTPVSILADNPVDLLVSAFSRSDVSKSLESRLWDFLDATPVCLRPILTLEILDVAQLIDSCGPMTKRVRKNMKRLGYSVRGQVLSNLDCGGAVTQDKMIVFAFNTNKVPESYASEWKLTPPPMLPPRPMTNCLRPFGAGSTETAPPGHATDQASIHIPDNRTAPMPLRAGDWIHVPTGY
jgi:hypothetical protein